MPKKRKNFRLPNKAGSVYKLPGNRRNPWTVKITLGYHNDGRIIRKYVGYYPTYEEALHALEMYKETPFDLNNKNITIERLYEILLEKKKDVATSTRNGYKTAYNHLASIANTPIRQLRKHDLQRVLDEAPVRPQSKELIRTLLNQLYTIAIDLDVTTRNYAQGLEIGKKDKRSIHKPFTALEIRKLWEFAEEEPFAEIPLILCYTGMRPQELLNVKISDVNIADKYLTGGLKTEAGKDRIIPLHSAIMPIIERRLNTSKAHLVEENGKGLSYMQLTFRWKKLMNTLGFSHLPHDGRHTFITLAQNKGMEKVTLQRIVGHASKDITDKVYTHKDIHQLVKAVNNL